MWQNRQSLQPDTKRPGKVHGVEGLVDDGCEYKGDSIEIIVRKGIGLLIIAEIEGFFLSHEVHGVGGESDEDDFHYEEVEAPPDEDEVDVACDENHEE